MMINQAPHYLNCIILQMNLNTNLNNPANERIPYANYDSNAWCVSDISGSSWRLANLEANAYEEDSTMTITCS